MATVLISLTVSLNLNMIKCQWRQSGLKSGGRGSGSNKSRLFQTNFCEISIFSGNFTRNFNFFRQIFKKLQFFRQFEKTSIFQAKIAHLQLLLAKLFYFSSKVTTFEHTSCT